MWCQQDVGVGCDELLDRQGPKTSSGEPVPHRRSGRSTRRSMGTSGRHRRRTWSTVWPPASPREPARHPWRRHPRWPRGRVSSRGRSRRTCAATSSGTTHRRSSPNRGQRVRRAAADEVRGHRHGGDENCDRASRPSGNAAGNTHHAIMLRVGCPYHAINDVRCRFPVARLNRR